MASGRRARRAFGVDDLLHGGGRLDMVDHDHGGCAGGFGEARARVFRAGPIGWRSRSWWEDLWSISPCI